MGLRFELVERLGLSVVLRFGERLGLSVGGDLEEARAERGCRFGGDELLDRYSVERSRGAERGQRFGSSRVKIENWKGERGVSEN